MLRDRLFATTVYFMAPPEGADGGGALNGGPGASATPAGGGVSSGAAADGAAAASTVEGPAVAAASESAPLTSPTESATHEASPSLLSSAAGKTPDQPAPAADAKPEVKAGDSPESKKDAAESAKPDDPGKAEGKADAATDPATKDATPAAAPALLSVSDLKLPEGASLDAEASKAFVDLLNNAELAGKDRGQGLIDLHTKEITRVAQAMSDHQRKVWDDLNAGWKNDLRNDKDLGGNRLNTSLSMAKAVVEEFLSADDAKALLVHTDNNGMGNFPVFIRLLHNIGKRMNVFEDGMVANAKPPAPAKGPGQRGWYDNTPTMGPR